MLIYLIKVSFVWMVFLGLYEIIFKSSRNFAANRFYLFFSLLGGIFFPLISFTTPVPLQPGVGVEYWMETTKGFSPDMVLSADKQPLSMGEVLWGIYLLGLAVLFLLWARELLQILRHAIYGRFRLWNGVRIFHSCRPHAPYSFMGWVFVYHPEHYSDRELLYILRHEAAHVKHRHGLDLILLHCICMVFWFHPLVWRYRYLVKLVHEYQADQYASKGAISQYGHFLLEQVMMKGTPSITHSFYFSPIKNRIKMLTSLKNPIRGNWKYIAILPALLACTFFLARAEDPIAQREHTTTFKGINFEWSKASMDTLFVVDPISGEETFATHKNPPAIVRANEDVVYASEAVNLSARDREGNKDVINDLTQALLLERPEIPDSIARIQIRNLVLSSKGEIIYYEVFYSTDRNKPAGKWYTSHPVLSPMLEAIMEASKGWEPALKDGKPVYEFYPEFFTMSI